MATRVMNLLRVGKGAEEERQKSGSEGAQRGGTKGRGGGGAEFASYKTLSSVLNEGEGRLDNRIHFRENPDTVTERNYKLQTGRSHIIAYA